MLCNQGSQGDTLRFVPQAHDKQQVQSDIRQIRCQEHDQGSPAVVNADEPANHDEIRQGGRRGPDPDVIISSGGSPNCLFRAQQVEGKFPHRSLDQNQQSTQETGSQKGSAQGGSQFV